MLRMAQTRVWPFIRFEGRGHESVVKDGVGAFPPFFMKAKVLEVGVSFAGLDYPEFWKDLEQVGPQLATLSLEVIEGMQPAIANSVEKLVEARFNKGRPLAKLER